MEARLSSPLQPLLAGGAALAAVLAATGFLQGYAFDQTSVLKYAVTVGACLVLLVTLTLRRRLELVVVLLLVAAPFASFTATFGGVEISVVTPLLLLGVVVALAQPRPAERRRPALGLAGVWLVALLVVPLLGGAHVDRHVGYLTAVLMSAWLVTSTSERRHGAHAVVAGIGLSAGIQAGLAIWQFHTGSRLDLYGATGDQVFGANYFFTFDDVFRPVGALTDPISLGNVLAIALPPLVVVAVAGRGSTLRLVTAAAAAVTAYALVLTLSRMSWIGGALGVAVAIAVLPRGRRLLPAVTVGAGVAAVLVLAVGAGGSAVTDRFETALAPTSSSSATAEGDVLRLRFWAAGVDIVEHHPVAGVGLGNVEDALGRYGLNLGPDIHVHSTYLQMAVQAGLLGVTALVVLLVALGRDLLAARRAEPVLGAGAIGAAVAMLVAWTTDYAAGYLPVAGSIAAVFGLAAGLARRPTSGRRR